MNYLVALIPFLLATLVLLITYTIRARRTRQQDLVFSQRLAERRRKREVQRETDELKFKELKGLNSAGAADVGGGKTVKSSGSGAANGGTSGATKSTGSAKKGAAKGETDMALVRRVIEEETAKAGRDGSGKKVKGGNVDVTMFPSVPKKDPGT